MFTFFVLLSRFAISALISFILGFVFMTLAMLFMPGSPIAAVAAVVSSLFASVVIDVVFEKEFFKLCLAIGVILTAVCNDSLKASKALWQSIFDFFDNFTADVFNKKNSIFRLA